MYCPQYKWYCGNAVVISSVVLLAVLIVVALTLSRYWDVVQRRSYNTMPLCGLDAPFRYQLLVVTGKRPAAGLRTCSYLMTLRQCSVLHGAFDRLFIYSILFAINVV